MTKKKIEDYFDFSNAPAATHGSSVVVGRDDTRGMSETVAAPQAVPAPTWQAPLDQKPAPTYGSSMVVGREMPIKQGEVFAPREAVAAPTWVAPASANAVPQMGGYIPRETSFDMAPQGDQVPAAQTAFSMDLSDNQGHVVTPFNPAFVNITAPTQDTRSGTYPQEAIANILRDTAGAPVLSGNGTPYTIPNQTTGNVAGGKGGAGGK